MIVPRVLQRLEREQWALEGWAAAVQAGRYLAVRYDCPDQSAADRLIHRVDGLGLTDGWFGAVAQAPVEQIAALPAVDPDPPPDPSAMPQEPAQAPATVREEADEACEPVAPPVAAPETSEPGAEPDRLIAELSGRCDPKPRRRWWRR